MFIVKFEFILWWLKISKNEKNIMEGNVLVFVLIVMVLIVVKDSINDMKGLI